MQNFGIFNLLKPLSDETQREREGIFQEKPSSEKTDASSPFSPPQREEEQKESLGYTAAKEFLFRHEGYAAKCKRGKK